jgi:hypothetical protein
MTGHAGTLLRSARRARRLKQWEVVRATGISLTRISVLENGHKPVRADEAERLALALGLDAHALTHPPVTVPPPERTVPPPSVTVRSFKDIPATCPCGWRMTFGNRRPSGWALAEVKPGCLHHESGARA